jgi:hypothetical protein
MDRKVLFRWLRRLRWERNRDLSDSLRRRILRSSQSPGPRAKTFLVYWTGAMEPSVYHVLP